MSVVTRIVQIFFGDLKKMASPFQRFLVQCQRSLVLLIGTTQKGGNHVCSVDNVYAIFWYRVWKLMGFTSKVHSDLLKISVLETF